MIIKYLVLVAAVLCYGACERVSPSSDEKQKKQQERILAEGTSQVGMPGIKNFRERKIVKTLFELRDQA